MSVSQSLFTKALFDPDSPRPAGLADGQGRAAGRRFDVYRNNVVQSLTEALEVGFPVIRKLVGESNFKILARAFVQQHQPFSPMLMFYGAQMPEFLETFEPTCGIRYLPDMARLEIALRESYHAADADPVDPARLDNMAPDKLMRARFAFVPALRLIQSDWPIHAIWQFNTEEGAPKPEMVAQDVLVLRPDFEPVTHLLSPGVGAFVAALRDGARLGAAVAMTSQSHQNFDLVAALGLLISGGAILNIGEKS